MQFSSGVFLILFLPLTIVLYKLAGLVPGYKCKNLVLLSASLVFYSWGEPAFIIVLIGGIVLNYIGGLMIDHTQSKKVKKILLFSTITVDLGVLFIFKYLSFATMELSRILPIKVLNISLPIGISFYTFQIMSYIFDVYYDKVPAQQNILCLALYICMFPQLVAGPIVRYSDIESEIKNRIETSELFYHGTHRFVIGLAKKVLIADYLGGIADKIFADASVSNIPLSTAWIGAIAFTFEIYYDFSGYSDMAIGLGNCFGFHFKENFHYPYASCSVQDFWRRWHISLTDWFRDYVYIPLGGNRVSIRRNTLNLFIVWLLTGIWHGAEWTFVIWGLYYFTIQLIEKRTGVTNIFPKIVRYFLTMIIVTIGWVIFKASNLTDAISYIGTMFNFSQRISDHNSLLYLHSSIIIFTISFVGAFPIIPFLLNQKIKALDTLYRIISLGGTIVLLCLCLLVIINGSYSPFIYFNF